MMDLMKLFGRRTRLTRSRDMFPMEPAQPRPLFSEETMEISIAPAGLSPPDTTSVSMGITEPTVDNRKVSPSANVVVLGGIYHIQFAPGPAIPLLQHHAPLRYLGEGWHFHSLYTAFAPVLLFELEHDTGARATWFFDSRARFLGHTVENIPPNYQSILLVKATELLRHLASPLLDACDAEETSPDLFFSISEIARLEIGSACCSSIFAPPTVTLLSDLPPLLMAVAKGRPSSPALLSAEFFLRALSEDFLDRLVASLVGEQFSWPSPISGTSQVSSGSFCFHHFSFAYRMVDEPTGLVYYLLTSDHNVRVIGFYFPSEGLIVVRDDQYRRALEAAFSNLPAMMMDYVCRHGDTFLPYLRRGGKKRIAGSLREDHLGHQLWNELSGLEALVTRLPPGQLPLLLPLAGPGNAFFGPLDAIFPEYKGKVRTDLLTGPEIIAFAHQNDLTLVRFTRDYVSAGLRDRILMQTRKSEDFRRVAIRRQIHAGPVILIGLRVENRTAVDLSAFVISLINCVAKAVPNALIVLDGQNANHPDSGQQATTSFQAVRAIQSPLEAELEICRTVMAAIDPSKITVVVATGATLATSIAWASLAACVISFWGAGLAKYRWIANRPTLVISNRDNLLNRLDLPIYSSERYMASPSPVEFADYNAIRDDLDAAQIIPIKEPSYANFDVDQAIFLPQVTQFLTPFASAR